jgi:hypothetical protein
MADNWTYVDKTFFTQNDLYDNVLKFGTPYVEHAAYKTVRCDITIYSHSSDILPSK